MLRYLKLIPEDIREKVSNGRWNCSCGQKDLCFTVTKKGHVRAGCFHCGRVTWLYDVQLFRFVGGPWLFGDETPFVKRLKRGGESFWYPKHRVRVFTVE